MYGIEEWRGALRLLGSLLTAHSHLERLTHESVVKGEDDPIDEVCSDKSYFFFFSSSLCSVWPKFSLMQWICSVCRGITQ